MLLATVNYVLVGLFNSDIDHYYLPSWGIWCSLVVVFNGFASVAFSMVRHQLKEVTFWRALLNAIKWLPFLIIYFSGISLNCAKALPCHAFSINIEWASTAKEPGPTGFYIGLDKMVQKFKWTWAICFVISAGKFSFLLFYQYANIGSSYGVFRHRGSLGLDDQTRSLLRREQRHHSSSYSAMLCQLPSVVLGFELMLDNLR